MRSMRLPRAADLGRYCAATVRFVDGLARDIRACLDELHPQFASDDSCGALQAFNRGAAVIWIKQSVDLCAARPHELSHALFGNSLLLHLRRKLQGNDGLDGGRGRLFPNTGFIEPAFEARSYVRVLLGHD